MEVRIPQGCLLKPNHPAALSCRTHALGRIFDVLSGLLGQGNPDFLCAAGFSDSPHFMYSGYKKTGEWYQLYQIGIGGVPGKPSGDGPDGHSLWPSFTKVPNEFLECNFPLRIENYVTLTDTGGPCKHRGGNALRISYGFLEDGEISINDDRWLTYPWGVNGGEPGRRSRKVLVRTDGREELMDSKRDRIKVNAGDVLHFDTWGGGGWGKPYERDPAVVAKDVDRGLVSIAGALRYGVVMRDRLNIDSAASDKLRAEMRAADADRTEIFNRGGTIEQLKALCFEQTGLVPPRAPEFQLRKSA
jgi:N-methylhydantoinase B